MPLLAIVLVGPFAALLVPFLVQEMFLWTKPLGWDSPQHAGKRGLRCRLTWLRA